MNMQRPNVPRVRPATAKDIPFLAQMEFEASLPPFGRSLWDDLLKETGTDTLTFIRAMFREDASNWGGVSDFLILELDGQPAAACAVFKPQDTPPSVGSFNLERLDQVAWSLSWSRDTTDAFRAAYEKAWGDDTTFLKPQADLIIETVAVAPDHRGKGLGTALMHAAFDRGRALDAESIGIMVIHGNDTAQALYEKHFKPYATFHAAYFNDEFPGLTKYRASLRQGKE